MPINKVVGLLMVGAGFGLSLSCIVYSALSLWRIHRRRLADLDRHRPLDYYDPNVSVSRTALTSFVTKRSRRSNV